MWYINLIYSRILEQDIQILINIGLATTSIKNYYTFVYQLRLYDKQNTKHI
ncbi:MAG: hypothetical protein ACI93P_001347 [bacterium]|jgi:hypothetical protein